MEAKQINILGISAFYHDSAACLIRDGKIAETLRSVMLTGNVFNTLANIDAIGNDLLIHDGSGGCGKGSQMPLPVSTGSPHIRIQKCLIGGS